MDLSFKGFFFPPLVFCINLTHEKTHFLCQNQVAIFLNFLSLYLSVHFWLCWVFVAAQAFLWLQPVGATLWLRCAGFPSLWLLLLQRTGSRVCRLQELWQEGSAAGAPGLWAQAQYLWQMRLVAPLPRSEVQPCLLHWQAHSLPLSYQGSPQIAT